MLDNLILLAIGLLCFCVVAVVGEILAKYYDWE
jgi:hypothetical protein